jgi:Lysyl oxidase
MVMVVRRRWIALVAVTAVALGLALGQPGAAVAAADRLPDLGMAPLKDFSIDTSTIPGRRLLRFTTVIVNVGVGPFETIGTRPDTSTAQMAVRQRIFDDAGSFRDRSTPAVMFWAGDGHDHWHVRDVEAYELIRLDNGRRVGTGAKHGFCYFDNTAYRLWLPGAPDSPVYGGCGTAADLTVTTGLSVGWGDTYPAAIAYQWIDITGLKSGRYRLRATADPANWFAEINDGNNSTWVDLKLTGSSVRVGAYGPAA